MSSEESDEEDLLEQLGEQSPIPGEKDEPEPEPQPFVEPPIKDKALTFQEASTCLNTLGKDETGARYAYLMMTATNRKLTDVSVIPKFRHVIFIDVSGNYLTLDALKALESMPFLILLRADRNRIESAALHVMPFLQVLSLAANSVCDTSDINQPLLETLDLSYNQIDAAAFNHLILEQLRILDMHGNLLDSLSGTYPTTVERLYLAGNRIRRIHGEDLAQLRSLRVLHLRNNRIRKLNGFSERLERLQYLNVRGNRINKFRQFAKLQPLPQLDTLIMLENPVSDALAAPPKRRKDVDVEEEEQEEEENEEMGEEPPVEIDRCVLPLLVLLPRLKRINKHTVTFDDRNVANIVRSEKTKEIMAEVSSEEEDETEPTTVMSDIAELEDDEGGVYEDVASDG